MDAHTKMQLKKRRKSRYCSSFCLNYPDTEIRPEIFSSFQWAGSTEAYSQLGNAEVQSQDSSQRVMTTTECFWILNVISSTSPLENQKLSPDFIKEHFKVLD